MQFGFGTNLSAEEYVRQKAWKDIEVTHCPIHPDQNCKVTRHGTYSRVYPEGTKIQRFLCHTEHITFSMLPDCFSSRLPGTLIEVENIVLMVEKARVAYSDQEMPPAVETDLAYLNFGAVADELGLNLQLFDLSSDYRWLKRRLEYVFMILSIVIRLFPEKFKNCTPSLISFRSVFGDVPILVLLRRIAESKLHEIPLPVGLNPRYSRTQDMAWKPP